MALLIVVRSPCHYKYMFIDSVILFTSNFALAQSQDATLSIYNIWNTIQKGEDLYKSDSTKSAIRGT